MASQICFVARPIRRIRFAGRAILLAVLIAGGAHANTGSEDRLAQISALIAQGDLSKAEYLADAALSQPHLSKQEESLLLSDRALVRNLSGRPQDALADYSKAIGTYALPQADQVTALLERGLVQEKLGRLRDAIEDYATILRLDPASTTALNNRADIYRRLGQMAAARRDYQASLNGTNTNTENAYYGLGKIAEVQNDANAARTYYNKALAANPDFVLASEALDKLNTISGRSAHYNQTEPSTFDNETPVLHQALAPIEKPIYPLRPRTNLHPDPGNVPGRTVSPRLRPAIEAQRGHAASEEAQLGAWRTEDEAAGGWVHATKLAGTLLTDVRPSIIPVDLPHKGQYFRLRINPTGNIREFCETLRAKDVDCIVVPN